MKLFLGILSVVLFMFGMICGTIIEREYGSFRKPVPVVMSVVCAQQLRRCEEAVSALQVKLMANQMSIYDQDCPLFNEFSEEYSMMDAR